MKPEYPLADNEIMYIINLVGFFDFHCSSGFIGLQPPIMISVILAETG
jgi:hypothetical protein